MELSAVLDLLRRERGVRVDEENYRRIGMWRDWWRGYHRPFHSFRERTQDGGVARRDLYSMRMAKKICEDWARVLLGELPRVRAGDPAADRFLQGEDGTGGALEACRFWRRAAELTEMAFYSGTGAFVLRVSGARADGRGRLTGSGAQLHLQCLPAMNLVPISERDGQITEAAFCSEVLCRGKPCLYLETHTLEGGAYVIDNRCFTARAGALEEAALPGGVAPRLVTGSAAPLFAILRPGSMAAQMSGGMGEAVFAHAIDSLKGVDLCFNNFCRDFLLGGKKVFYNRSLLQGDGEGGLLAPDDLCQQLFVAVADKMPGDAQMIHEHNPALRVRDNIDGLQAQLDFLALRCGLGSGYYRILPGEAVTATQYVGQRQELARSAARHGLELRDALVGAMRMLLWAGRNVMGLPLHEECALDVRLDDSVIVDRETLRQNDRIDTQAGLMSAEEYRRKWLGGREGDDEDGTGGADGPRA